MKQKLKFDFKKSNTTKVIAILISVFAIAYFVYQIYMFTYVPYETEIALIHKYTDQIDIKGIVLKQEQILQDSNSGIVKYTNMQSSKVVSGTELANVYTNLEDLKTTELIKQKQQQVDLLTSLENKKDEIKANTQNITSNIKQQQIEFVNALQKNDLKSLNNVEYSFLEDMLKQEIVINQEISYEEQINNLNSEIAQLSSTISQPGAVVKAHISGYFSSVVDGLESVTYETATADLSLSAVNSLIEQKIVPDTTKVGKIITSTNWNFLGVFDAKYIEKFKEGNYVNLVFPQNPSHKVDAKIEKITYNEGDEQGTILLSSSNMSDDIVNLRLENPSIIIKESSGIKIPKNAVRIMEIEEKTEDGNTIKVATPGVYVNMGQIVKFKKIDIAFETEEYVISSVKSEERDYLQIYDEIILEGENLYDGKPIR